MWILTETESSAPKHIHNESFDSLESAKKRLHQLYRDNAVEGDQDTIERAEFNETSAMVTLTDGNKIWWHIKEV